VGTSKERPPGDSQRAPQRDITQGMKVPHDGPAEVPVRLEAGEHKGVTGMQIARILVLVTRSGSSAARLGVGGNVGRVARTTSSSAQPEPRRRRKQTKPATAPACLVRNFRGGQRRAPDPAGTHANGVEACCSGKHARQVTALHHGQLAVSIGEADGTLVPRLGETGVGGFAEELHGTGTEPPQRFKRDRAERISRAVVVGEVVPALVVIPKSSGMARGASSKTNVGSSQGIDERGVRENVARPGAQIAVIVPA
jgi:hypothetical protein